MMALILTHFFILLLTPVVYQVIPSDLALY